jgi:hypothetical protein
MHFHPGISPPESSITDINHAFIAIKLWLMLAQIVSRSDNSDRGDDGGDQWALFVWNELWPPFENLLNILEGEAHTNSSVPWLSKFLCNR